MNNLLSLVIWKCVLYMIEQFKWLKKRYQYYFKTGFFFKEGGGGTMLPRGAQHFLALVSPWIKPIYFSGSGSDVFQGEGRIQTVFPSVLLIQIIQNNQKLRKRNYPGIFLSFCQYSSIYLSFHLSIFPSIYISIYSVCLFNSV